MNDMELGTIYSLGIAVLAVLIGVLILAFPEQALKQQRKSIERLIRFMPSLYKKASQKTDQDIRRDNSLVGIGFIFIGILSALRLIS